MGWEDSRRLMERSRSIVTLKIHNGFILNSVRFFFCYLDKLFFRPRKSIVHDIRTDLKQTASQELVEDH